MAILIVAMLTACSWGDKETQDHIQILDEIPEHILEVENLTIFPGDSEPRYSVELTPVQTFGKTGEPFLTSIVNGAVDDNGRLIILDVNFGAGSFPPDNRIIVYNPDGSFLTEIGGPGRGPGEFGLTDIPRIGNGKVFVHDLSGRRVNAYNADDYSFERTSIIEQWSVRNHEAVRDLDFRIPLLRHDGNHLARFIERFSDSGRDPVYKYMLVDSNGDVLNNEPIVFPGSFTVAPRQSMPGPTISLSFMGSTITTLSREDALYSAWTQDFLIKKHDADGVYQSAIYYPVKGPPFDLNNFTGTPRYSAQDVRNALENSDEELPQTNAVLSGLRVDDENRIWVSVHGDPMNENTEWWILAPSGELLAKLSRPHHPPIFDIRNGHLYSKEIDEETGAEWVVQYRIDFTEAE